MKGFKLGLISAALVMSAGSANVSAAMIKSPLYLNYADSGVNAAQRLKFSGKSRYKITLPFEKGIYKIQVSDQGQSCGLRFGPEDGSKFAFSKPLALNACANDRYFELNIRFAGNYELILDNSQSDKPTLQVARKAKASSFKRSPPAVDCIQWDGQPITVDVSSTFNNGQLVKDFYSGQTQTVMNGQVSMQPDPASGGLLLLEAADGKASEFSWDNASVYFIMTDRFNNGDTSNDFPFHRKADGKQEAGTFQGGDFSGITAKLDYIKDLGMNAIWVTPIVEQIHGFIGGGDHGRFPFYGYHGYWALDFTKIDPNLGSEQDFGRFVDEAHKRGIRVLVDVVMNHVGYPTLDDMQTMGIDALAPHAPVPKQWTDWQPDLSKGQNWYRYTNFIRWSSSEWVDKWWGPDWVRSGMAGYTAPGGDDITMNLSGLPDLITEGTKSVSLPPFLKHKKDTKAVEREGYTVSDYLIEWHTNWVRDYGVDGFRADTVKHVEPEVWGKLKQAGVEALADWKAKHPDKKLDDKPFWMVGEVWHHGAYKDFYFDNGMDSLINFEYGGGKAALKGAQCLPQNEGIYASYAKEINRDPNYNLLTYISSHDTKLFYSNYEDLTLQAGAGTALMMMPGGVQLYYGDESARPRGPQSDAFDAPTRSFMNWQQITKEADRQALLKHWQTLGQFRKRHVAIGAGEHHKISDKPYAFSRSKGNDKVVVVFAGLQ
ncbi:alpha-amylase [Agarivorans sp. QJM3NY_29]|uniref:alpha-amylase n=1 Tax=unclassified Agarivorans TaxID=2636026 RepID=UPI003D7C4C99